MTSVSQTVCPNTPGRFARRWLSATFNQPWTHASSVATALGALVPLLIRLRPAWAQALTDLIWQIPLGVFATWGIARMALAPYWLHQEDAAIHLASITESEKQIAEQQQELEVLRDRLTAKLKMVFVGEVQPHLEVLAFAQKVPQPSP